MKGKGVRVKGDGPQPPCADILCRKDAFATDALGAGAGVETTGGDGCRQEREGEAPPASWPADDLLSIGEVARRSGVAVSALRYYETLGLIKSCRSEGNHRLYARSVLRRIAVIKVAQRTGLSLQEIRDALATLPDWCTPTRADWTKLSKAWKADLEARIDRLTRLRDQLEQCIGCGCLSLSDCPLRNPNDRLAAEGPGPRLLDPGADV